MYDVVISGAGPAGCITAKLLADSGYSVLIADKTAMPRTKSCSGILIQKSVGILEHTFGKIPHAVYAEPHLNKGMILNTDTGMKVPIEGLCLSIWRSLLDYWMIMEVVDAGAVFLEETPVTGFTEKKDHVVVRLGGKSASGISARVLAGCDGPAGTIRRKLRKKPGDCITTYQIYFKGEVDLDPAYFHTFLQPELSDYDAWCTVKDDYIITGVGVYHASDADRYQKKFLAYLAENHHARFSAPEFEERWLLPHITPENPVDKGEGRIFLAGDAANLLNPLGEGISGALVSGSAFADAFRCAAGPTENPDLVRLRAGYETNLSHTIEHMHRQWRFLAEISPKFAHLRDI
ncbi:MAG: FAD-dependent monooxygenase [Methanocorpusculum sp.]|uniref:FAD-dependent monooxygenase n=1 Tax=Methanocorpusculum petauri TaxID=3002863 RepID=A0ABT4IF32_9EURY|nr:FAD-dependent monooxygenase [Methanocorpusculum petauri]MCZ9313578.1 FAD-dependent monooxygenase [Methanocorpusculum sp.]MCZ0860346.1 FAD-dependent monooxygenase [Methanocorpusculum petauri]MDE2444195.1 FAD-dependent monooxygenase [Methanocorpusculum sp.]MDE2518466.1 FAD-dependent monooxygenase [Methanocorpusculum sp.]MDE2522596.1 FAD-dependent monooxygenase [Methanocorpusculum sp.]